MAEIIERTTALIALRPGREPPHPLPGMGRFTETAGLLLARIAPGQVLAMRAGVDAALMDELAPWSGHAGLIDLSDSRVGVRIAGPDARERLAQLVPLDLDERRFPVGACAMTLAAHLAVLVLRHGPQEFELQCGRSFEGSFLRAAAQRAGVDGGSHPPLRWRSVAVSHRGVACMSEMTHVARQFFDACETGAGWTGCRAYCTPHASFSAQAEPLRDVHTIEAPYAEWMKGLLTVLPDGRYESKSFAVDEQSRTVTIYAVFSGTHTGQGGPVPPTGKGTVSDYVYVLAFDGAMIARMTKIWNSGHALKELGWA